MDTGPKLVRSFATVPIGNVLAISKAPTMQMTPIKVTRIDYAPSEIDPLNWDITGISSTGDTFAPVELEWVVRGDTFIGSATFTPDFFNGPVIVLMDIRISATSTRNIDKTKPWSITVDTGGWLKNLVEVSSGSLVSNYVVAFRRYFYAFAGSLPKVTVTFSLKTFFTLPIQENMPLLFSWLTIPTYAKSLPPPVARPLFNTPHIGVHPALKDAAMASQLGASPPSLVKDSVTFSPRPVPSAALDYDLLEDVDDVKHHHPWRV